MSVAFTEFFISSSLMRNIETSMEVHVGHLQCYFPPEETAYSNTILSQQSDCILCDYPIRISSRKIWNEQSLWTVEELWLSNLGKEASSIYHAECKWAEISYFYIIFHVRSVVSKDGSFPLWRTAFGLNFKDSVNIRQFWGSCSCSHQFSNVIAVWYITIRGK
jgi:hypothetical protein